MFTSEALQDDKELKQDLFAATSRVVALAKIAAHGSDHENFSEVHDVSNLRISDTEDINSMEPELQEASAVSDSGPESKLELNIEDIGHLEVSGDQATRSLTPSRVLQTFQDPSSIPTVSPSPYSVFGNGWFGRRPLVEGLDSHVGSVKSGIQDPLALKIVETTLRTGYLALLGEEASLTNLQKKLFRWALYYHSRDELLFNLRWFLGPGRSSLPILGQASFGFPESYVSPQNSDSFTFGIGSPNVLNPFVDVSAIADAHERPIRSVFLNAFDIENYLKRMGAFYFDQAVVKMEVQIPEKLSVIEVPVKSTHGVSTAHSQEVVVEEGNDMPPWELDLGYASSGFGTPADISCIPSCEPSIYSFSESTETYDKRSPQLVTLNVPLLLQNLAKVSVCLGKGPGYLQKDVDQAIVSSVLQMTAA